MMAGNKNLLLFLLSLSLIAFLSCDTKNQTAIEKNQSGKGIPLRVTQLDVGKVIDENATTFILVRHAEKEKEIKDPGLTEKGIKRAKNLYQVLEKIPIQVIYSTDFHRTKMTVEHTALMRNLDGNVKIYDHRDLEGAAKQMLNDHSKKVVLVSGHSNTTPEMINILTKTEDWQPLSESDYDNLFIISVYENAPAKVQHFKYGEPNHE